MKILGIDPGTEQSGWVIYEPPKVLEFGITNNTILQQYHHDNMFLLIGRNDHVIDVMAIEMVANMGMQVGVDIFETIFWIGRFW